MRTCAVLSSPLARQGRGGGDDVVFRGAGGDARRRRGREREASSRCPDVWRVSHVCWTGLGWVKIQSPLCQIRFLGWPEKSPLRGLDSACRGVLGLFHPKTRLPKRGLNICHELRLAHKITQHNWAYLACTDPEKA
jgi:hypothetical protein